MISVWAVNYLEVCLMLKYTDSYFPWSQQKTYMTNFYPSLFLGTKALLRSRKKKNILYIESNHHFCFLGKEFPPVSHPRRQSIILSSKNSQKLLLVSLL